MTTGPTGLDALTPWLDSLASAAPTPGGGGAAAVVLGVGAALVEMVANVTLASAKWEAFHPACREAAAAARATRAQALSLAAEDERAFDAVMATYRKGSGTTPADRDAALVAAADVPRRVAELAAAVIDLAERLTGASSPNVASDLTVALALAQGAARSSYANVEVNRVLLSADHPARAELQGRLAGVVDVEKRAAALLATTRPEDPHAA